MYKLKIFALRLKKAAVFLYIPVKGKNVCDILKLRFVYIWITFIGKE